MMENTKELVIDAQPYGKKLTMGNQALQDKQLLMQMCYQEPRMVENLPKFYRKIVNVKDCDNRPLFESWELDQIVIAAQEEAFPIVSAKQWGVFVGT